MYILWCHINLNKPATAQVGAISKAQKDSRKKISEFFEIFFEVSGKSHSAEKCKRGDAFYLMLDALDALKMKY